MEEAADEIRTAFVIPHDPLVISGPDRAAEARPQARFLALPPGNGEEVLLDG